MRAKTTQGKTRPGGPLRGRGWSTAVPPTLFSVSSCVMTKLRFDESMRDPDAARDGRRIEGPTSNQEVVIDMGRGMRALSGGGPHPTSGSIRRGG